MMIAIVLAISFVSCNKNEENEPTNLYGKSYLINYGNYNKKPGTVSLFNTQDSTVSNGYYKSVNGVDVAGTIQYAYKHDDKIYFMGNAPDAVFYVNKTTFRQTANVIKGNDIIKPRYCVAQGNTLYVSCWGGNVWEDNTVSYIAKIDLSTHKLNGKIKLPGGTEGMAIVDNKLYVALPYSTKSEVAVIDLKTEKISYIDTKNAKSYYFIKDNMNNLYVALASYNPSGNGIGYIDTKTNTATFYELNDIMASSYDNVFRFNEDYSKLYVSTSKVVSYKPYTTSGGIAVFDIAGKKFESKKLINDVKGFIGIDNSPIEGNLNYFVAESTTAPGKMVFIKQNGTKIKEYTVGFSPIMMLNIK